LDPAGREDILANIDRYRRVKDATIMMVSHSMGDVARMASRMIVMCDARLAMDGTPNEVFSHAQELLEMGLDIPEITRVFLNLQKMGLPVEPVYTTQHAVEQLRRLKGGNIHA
jgi:energy-coupling factor transport system ATP-binding protein